MNIDIEDFDMKNDRIETEIMKDMKSYNYSTLDKILVNTFNEIKFQLEDTTKNTSYIKTDKFYYDYKT